MDEERLSDNVRLYKGGSIRQGLRSFAAVYVLLALSFLLLTLLSSVSLARIAALSSKLSTLQSEPKHNFSSRDSLLFPCGAQSRQWEYFEGRCYYFSLSRMSWHKAKAECEEMHSHLIIIDSYAKQNFVMFRTRNERFWIGLTDENQEGEWQWVDGTDTRSSFTLWGRTKPHLAAHINPWGHTKPHFLTQLLEGGRTQQQGLQ
uniref:C-type lectin domain-containing protein n=1 Tax=Gallus gallus TaxID=9031 RepID=A0A8V0XHL0_CHICK